MVLCARLVDFPHPCLMMGGVTRTHWSLLVMVAGLGIAATLWFRPQRSGDALPPLRARPAASGDSPSLPFMGTASCAGRSCHGSLEPMERNSSWQMEYALWTSQDPHTRAYRVLLEPRAQEMARRIGIAGGKAQEAALCLACHTQPPAVQTPTNPAATEHVQRERWQGVGCEACHGNAKDWFDAHISEGWRAKTPRQKALDHGLSDLGDPATLVRTCARCHVGGPAADVNHDLIAAGHPRLMFEASAYYGNLPKHWKPRPRSESQLWAVGQVVSAEAALELLRHRATSPDAPWPEFSEYDCASCHHDLTEPRTRKSVGRWKWGEWYLTMPRLLADDIVPPNDGAQSMLQQLMEKWAPPRSLVREQVEPTLADLKKLQQRLSGWTEYPKQAEQNMRELLLKRDRPFTGDAAEQFDLARWTFQVRNIKP